MGRGPPGSAGVPPACTPVACRSVSLRCGTRPPCRRERHGLGRSRAVSPLPVEPGGGDGQGCARTCAVGTPALPDDIRLDSQESDQPARLAVHRLLVLFIRPYGSLVSLSYVPPGRTGGELTDHGRQSRPRWVVNRRTGESLTSRREVVAKLGGLGRG